MSTTKGFNLIIASSAEELGNYVMANNLGEAVNLEALIHQHAQDTDASAIFKGLVATEVVNKLPVEGKGEWYFLLAKPDVWQPGTGKSPHAIAVDAIAASRFPDSIQFLANQVVVITGNEGVVVRCATPTLDVNPVTEEELKTIEQLASEDTFLGRLVAQGDDTLATVVAERLKMAKRPALIGNIKEGEVFVVNNQGYQAVTGFNFWAAAHDYANLPGLDSSLEFDDYLSIFSLANVGQTDEENDAMQKLWGELTQERQAELMFQIDHELAIRSFGQLLAFEALLGDYRPQLMTVYVAVIAAALDLEGQLKQHAAATHEEVVRIMTLDEAERLAAFTELAQNILYLHQDQRLSELTEGESMIITHRYPANKQINVVQTVGVSGVAGFDVVMAVALLSDTSETLIEGWCQWAANRAPEARFDVCDELANLGEVDGMALRLKAIEIDGTAALADGLIHPRTNPKQMLQLLIADSKNILPDEEGYDTNFIQPVFSKNAG